MRDRGVSEVLGYALVFSLVIVTVSIISVGGLSGYQKAQDFERQTNAEKAYDVMHNNIEDIYYKGAPSRATEIDLGESQIYLGDPVDINVSVNGTEELNVTSRPIIQNLGDDNRLIYEAGAVFQTSRQGGIQKRDPAMTLGSDRVHIIVPNISQGGGTSGLGNGIVRVRARSLGQELSQNTTIESGNITVTIENTSRADLWREYFERKPLFGSCDLPNDSKTRTVRCDSDTFVEELYLVQSDISIFFDR
jgi:hypothetical protein